jgi:hypothetical protein
MNKKRRQELKQLKFINRIKRFIANGKYYFTKDRERIDSPTVQDIINDGGFLCYKTTSTPCSCYTCSGEYKYRRHEHKIIERKLVQEGLEDYYNLD